MGGRTLGDMRSTAGCREGEYFTLKNSRRIANNTLEYTCKDGRRCIQHHNTRVLTFFPNGDIEVSPERWETTTTRQRIQDGLRGTGIMLSGNRYGWTVCKSWDGEHVKVDGAVLLPHGNLPDPPEGAVWDLYGRAAEPDEYDRQRRFRLTTHVRRELSSTWRYQDEFSGEVGGRYNRLIRQALAWEKHTPESIEYILGTVYIKTPDTDWQDRPTMRVSLFEPASKLICHAVFAYLKANPDELDFWL